MADPTAHHHGHRHSHGHDHGDGTCDHARERSARVPVAMAEAAESCEKRNLRLTPIRRQVLEALYASHRPASAYELIETLATGGEKKHAPVTIYRALDFLLDNGFAHRLESRNAFIACPFHHAPGELVVFMICESCGGVDEAVSEPLSAALADLAGAQGFRPRARVIELAGRCAHCAD
ncbi:MAG: transcriptional repressor [Burkholderiales bacterium]|nr:transcriptional repressor [Burkholderiales bacterium]